MLRGLGEGLRRRRCGLFGRLRLRGRDRGGNRRRLPGLLLPRLEFALQFADSGLTAGQRLAQAIPLGLQIRGLFVCSLDLLAGSGYSGLGLGELLARFGLGPLLLGQLAAQGGDLLLEVGHLILCLAQLMLVEQLRHLGLRRAQFTFQGLGPLRGRGQGLVGLGGLGRGLGRPLLRLRPCGLFLLGGHGLFGHLGLQGGDTLVSPGEVLYSAFRGRQGAAALIQGLFQGGDLRGLLLGCGQLGGQAGLVRFQHLHLADGLGVACRRLLHFLLQFNHLRLQPGHLLTLRGGRGQGAGLFRQRRVQLLNLGLQGGQLLQPGFGSGQGGGLLVVGRLQRLQPIHLLLQRRQLAGQSELFVLQRGRLGHQGVDPGDLAVRGGFEFLELLLQTVAAGHCGGQLFFRCGERGLGKHLGGLHLLDAFLGRFRLSGGFVERLTELGVGCFQHGDLLAQGNELHLRLFLPGRQLAGALVQQPLEFGYGPGMGDGLSLERFDGGQSSGQLRSLGLQGLLDAAFLCREGARLRCLLLAGLFE